MSEVTKVMVLLEKVRRHRLEGMSTLLRYSPEELAEMYNGIGPDAFPEWLRDCISSLHPSLEPAALVHDVEWHESDGSRQTFKATNERFQRNGYRLATGEFAWYNPRRWLVMNQARRFGNYCQTLGWLGWLKCHREAVSKQR